MKSAFFAVVFAVLYGCYRSSNGHRAAIGLLGFTAFASLACEVFAYAASNARFPLATYFVAAPGLLLAEMVVALLFYFPTKWVVELVGAIKKPRRG